MSISRNDLHLLTAKLSQLSPLYQERSYISHSDSLEDQLFRLNQSIETSLDGLHLALPKTNNHTKLHEKIQEIIFKLNERNMSTLSCNDSFEYNIEDFSDLSL